MQDLFTITFFAGTIGYGYRFLMDQLLYQLGITNFLYWEYAADLFLPHKISHSFQGFTLGFFTDWLGVLWVSLIIALAIKITGRDYFLIKGAVIGASSWLLVYGFLTQGGLLGIIRPDNFISGITSFALDTTMGMVVATALILLSRRTGTRQQSS